MALQLASSVGEQRVVQSSSEEDRGETLPLLQSTWLDWDGNRVVDEVRVRVLVNWEGEEEEEEEEEEETSNQKLLVSVRGMTCAACSTSVEMALKRLPAVMTAAVTLIQENAEIL
jgi:CO dehydrogenase/acetyl-CoA synthase beta subunit